MRGSLITSITIELNPITKKNSQRIIVNRRTGRPQIIQSAKYTAYEIESEPYLRKYTGMNLQGPVEIQTVFYMPTRRRVDLSNLIEAAHDILTKYKVIADDNCRVVVSVDGSRVCYDKNRPRTEINIYSYMPDMAKSEGSEK